jgi:predicted enzyme related to lactoylglutathione lyase
MKTALKSRWSVTARRHDVILTRDDLDAVLARSTAQGATILYPKKDIGEIGYVAEIEDSEGNRIALSMPK